MLFNWGCLCNCKPMQFAAVGLVLRIGVWVRVGAKLNCDLRWAQHFSRSAFPGRQWRYAGWALHRRRWPCKWNSTVGVCHGLLAVILKTSTCETSSTSTSTSTCETQPLQSSPPVNPPDDALAPLTPSILPHHHLTPPSSASEELLEECP